jgi:hypothetical protein
MAWAGTILPLAFSFLNPHINPLNAICWHY